MPEEKCVFCLIAQGKIESAKIFEDEVVSAFLDINPTTQGHTQVISKNHAPLISMLSDAEKFKLFSVSQNIGSNLIKKLGAKGITYLINEGSGAGQNVPHASIQVIPRYDNDGFSFSTNQKKMSQEEVVAYLNNILTKLQAKAPEPAPVEKKKEEIPLPPEEKKEEYVNINQRVPKY